MSSIKDSLDKSADQNYDRIEELKAFEQTKIGVKGIVDSGIVNVPKIFIRPVEELAEESNLVVSDLQVPVIDLSGIESPDQQKRIVDEVKQASKEWGFFLVVNHGIPLDVLANMIDGIKKFHEQDAQVKMQFHSREFTRKVKYGSNVDLYRSKAVNWKDTLTIASTNSDHKLEPDELPEICRDSTIEYLNQVSKLGQTLFKLLSEALGLEPDYLGALECGQRRILQGHYYPACPEPELTMGASKHTDPSFITVLLQDQIGGLQVIHNSHYVDVPTLVGSLVVFIGEMLQILSNDEFICTDHRVVANRVGPRISVAGFFNGDVLSRKIYAPIKALISEEHPPRCKEFTVKEYIYEFFGRTVVKSRLEGFRLP